MVSAKAFTAAAILATATADICLPIDPVAITTGLGKLLIDLVANLSHALVDTGHGIGSVAGLLLEVIYSLNFVCLLQDVLDVPTDLTAGIIGVLNTILTLPDGLDAILAHSPLGFLGGLSHIL